MFLFLYKRSAFKIRVAARLSDKTEWSLAAVDIASGKKVIHAGNAENRFLIPGSLLKLFITAALLEQNSRSAVDFSTVISIHGSISSGKLHGDVIIKGSGNSLLSTKDLLAAVGKIKSLGIKEVAGDVIVDDSLFDVKGWNGKYAGPAYGVPSALGLDLHTVSIAIEGERIVVDPMNDAVKVSLNPSNKLRIRQIDDLTYEITGEVGNTPAFHDRFSLRDPALYAAGAFLTLLRKQGIMVSGVTKRGILPSHASEVIRVSSYDVNALIRDTNKQSLNVAADNMLFLLGALAYGAPGTQEKGIRAVNSFLSELGVQLGGLVIADGSGVSNRNRISAEQMVTFLQVSTVKPWFNVFYESLSRPGMDGRLQDFGYRSERIRVKSGQVADAYSLAGYIDRMDGKKIAFVYMVNGSGLDTPMATSTGAEVLRQLSE